MREFEVVRSGLLGKWSLVPFELVRVLVLLSGLLGYLLWRLARFSGKVAVFDGVHSFLQGSALSKCTWNHLWAHFLTSKKVIYRRILFLHFYFPFSRTLDIWRVDRRKI